MNRATIIIVLLLCPDHGKSQVLCPSNPTNFLSLNPMMALLNYSIVDWNRTKSLPHPIPKGFHVSWLYSSPSDLHQLG